MHRGSSFLSGRDLFCLLLTVLVAIALFDLSVPDSPLHTPWNSLFPTHALVEQGPGGHFGTIGNSPVTPSSGFSGNGTGEAARAVHRSTA